MPSLIRDLRQYLNKTAINNEQQTEILETQTNLIEEQSKLINKQTQFNKILVLATSVATLMVIYRFFYVELLQPFKDIFFVVWLVFTVVVIGMFIKQFWKTFIEKKG